MYKYILGYNKEQLTNGHGAKENSQPLALGRAGGVGGDPGGGAAHEGGLAHPGQHAAAEQHLVAVDVVGRARDEGGYDPYNHATQYERKCIARVGKGGKHWRCYTNANDERGLQQSNKKRGGAGIQRIVNEGREFICGTRNDPSVNEVHHIYHCEGKDIQLNVCGCVHLDKNTIASEEKRSDG
jgi:hypothetical protein